MTERANDAEVGGGVVALVADLIFASRIRGAAGAGGPAVRTVSRPDALLEAARADAPSLLLVDLDVRAGDAVAAIRALKAEEETAGIPLVAFVSHVREDAIAAAREAGADRVLARSAFVRALPELLAGAS